MFPVCGTEVRSVKKDPDLFSEVFHTIRKNLSVSDGGQESMVLCALLHYSLCREGREVFFSPSAQVEVPVTHNVQALYFCSTSNKGRKTFMVMDMYASICLL